MNPGDAPFIFGVAMVVALFMAALMGLSRRRA